jgi:hypothetical protein
MFGGWGNYKAGSGMSIVKKGGLCSRFIALDKCYCIHHIVDL